MICARCRHFTNKVPPEVAAQKRCQCVVFLAAINDFVEWNETCRLYRAAQQMAPREQYIKKMENDDVGNKNAVDASPRGA